MFTRSIATSLRDMTGAWDWSCMWIIRRVWGVGLESYCVWIITIGGNCHKSHFCRDKCFVATITCLSRQNPSFVATNYVCRDIFLFVATNLLSRQIFVATNIILFVATKLDTCGSSSPRINNTQSMRRGIRVIMYVNIFWDSNCNVFQHIRRVCGVGLESQCMWELYFVTRAVRYVNTT